MRGNTGIIGPTQNVGPSAPKGSYGIVEQYIYARNESVGGERYVSNAWVTITPNVSLVNEGQSVVFAIDAYLPDGQTSVFWAIRSTPTATPTKSDFADSTIIGTLALGAANQYGVRSATLTKNLIFDFTVEADEQIVVDISLSIDGPVIATSSPIVSAISMNPFATVSVTPASLNEGASATYTITAGNMPAGTTLYWVMRATTGTTLASDFADSTLSGSYTVSNGLVDTITRTWANDATTEGTETWVMDIKTGSISGTVIGTSSPVTTVADTSMTPFATITPSNTTINEGGTSTYTITVGNVMAGTTLYWVMRATTGTTLASDFADSTLSGSYTVSNGLVNTITRTWANDATTEGTEAWVMDIKTGSITGTVIGTSTPVITVADTSMAPVATITSTPASLNEGSSVTYTITTANVASGTTLYWVMRATTGTELAADFTDATLSGSYSLAVGLVNTITRTWANDVTTEGTEIWVMDIKTGSISGTVIGTSSPATTVADTSVSATPTVPTANLYCHYDWSMVTGTSWVQSGQLSAGGTAIGLSSTTPAIAVAMSSSAYPLSSGTTSSGRKYLSFPASTGINVGVTVASSGGAFPDITSAGYSFFEVRRMMSNPGGFMRTSMWCLNGFGTDYNGAIFWVNGSSLSDYIYAINYSSGSSTANFSPIVSRATTNVVHVNVVTIIGSSYRWVHCTGSTTLRSGSGTLSPAPVLSTSSAANRVLNIHDLRYGGNFTVLHAMEYGFYSAPLSNTTADATAVLLYNKWV